MCLKAQFNDTLEKERMGRAAGVHELIMASSMAFSTSHKEAFNGSALVQWVR